MHINKHARCRSSTRGSTSKNTRSVTRFWCARKVTDGCAQNNQVALSDHQTPSPSCVMFLGPRLAQIGGDAGRCDGPSDRVFHVFSMHSFARTKPSKQAAPKEASKRRQQAGSTPRLPPQGEAAGKRHVPGAEDVTKVRPHIRSRPRRRGAPNKVDTTAR